MSIVKENNSLNRRIIFVCATITLLYNYLPVVSGFFGTIFVFPIIITGCFFVFFGNTIFLSKNIVTVIFVALYLIGYEMMCRYDIQVSIYRVIRSVFLISLPLYYISTNNQEDAIKLFWLSIILMMITEITTIFGNTIYPGASRFLINGDNANSSDVYKYARMNIGGFSTAYSLPGIILNLFILLKEGKIKKSLFIAIIVVSFIFLIGAEFTLAIVLLVVSVILVLVSFNRSENILKNLLILFIAVLIFSGPISNLIGYFARNVEGDMLKERMYDMSAVMSGADVEDTNAADARINAYTETINDIKEHFIFGKKFAGERIHPKHSSLGEFFASYGLIGLFVMVAMFALMYQNIYRGKKKCKYYKVIICSQIMFVVPFIINQIDSSTCYWAMFGLSSAVPFMIEEKEEEKEVECKEVVIKKSIIK